MDKYPSLFLFHQEKFIFRNPDQPVIIFEHQSAKIYFSEKDKTLVSLDNAPFGSFITGQPVEKMDLLLCLEKVLSWSSSNKIRTVTIRSFPDTYDDHSSKMIKQSLLETSFDILHKDITQVVKVDRETSMAVNADKKRRLRTAEAKGFQFKALPLRWLEKSYALIVQSRVSKGYPVTMTLEQLERMFTLFPNEYMLFGVFGHNKLIAASVSIKVTDKIVYCFYLGDDLKYRPISPVTTLVNGIYNFCNVNHFTLLDLGLSTDNGKLNEGLYNFKKTFGALDSFKLTFIKQL